MVLDQLQKQIKLLLSTICGAIVLLHELVLFSHLFCDELIMDAMWQKAGSTLGNYFLLAVFSECVSYASYSSFLTFWLSASWLSQRMRLPQKICFYFRTV